jgi:hypothetical protein
MFEMKLQEDTEIKELKRIQKFKKTIKGTSKIDEEKQRN